MLFSVFWFCYLVELDAPAFGQLMCKNAHKIVQKFFSEKIVNLLITTTTFWPAVPFFKVQTTRPIKNNTPWLLFAVKSANKMLFYCQTIHKAFRKHLQNSIREVKEKIYTSNTVNIIWLFCKWHEMIWKFGRHKIVIFMWLHKNYGSQSHVKIQSIARLSVVQSGAKRITKFFNGTFRNIQSLRHAI